MERCSGIEPDRDAVLQTAAFPFRQHLKLVVRQGFEPCMSVCKTDAFPSWRTDHSWLPEMESNHSLSPYERDALPLSYRAILVERVRIELTLDCLQGR